LGDGSENTKEWLSFVHSIEAGFNEGSERLHDWVKGRTTMHVRETTVCTRTLTLRHLGGGDRLRNKLLKRKIMSHWSPA
jgi:hypothetical protein